jgi:hypothetical protein
MQSCRAQPLTPCDLPSLAPPTSTSTPTPAPPSTAAPQPAKYGSPVTAEHSTSAAVPAHAVFPRQQDRVACPSVASSPVNSVPLGWKKLQLPRPSLQGQDLDLPHPEQQQDEADRQSTSWICMQSSRPGSTETITCTAKQLLWQMSSLAVMVFWLARRIYHSTISPTCCLPLTCHIYQSM